MLKYLRGSLILTVFGLVIAAVTGWYASGTPQGVFNAVFIVAVLSVLEVSLSFDNAVINATVLRDMTPVWRHRFMTWGILVAVVGMRIVLPLVIVAILGSLSPIEVLVMAARQPEEYGRILTSAHISVSAFGGAFLAMVGLAYFFDHEKDVHWIHAIEARLSSLGRIDSFAIGVVLVVLYLVSNQLEPLQQLEFLIAGIFGLITYIAVAGLGDLLKSGEAATTQVARSGLSSFLYLEVLDASFSFDGVIGAFALSTNLIVIAIGLGVGAMFVRSLTLMFVEHGTLTQFRYLEHGAFYAIIVLGVTMFLQSFVHIPEVISGLTGAVAIGLAFWSSVRHNRAIRASAPVPKPSHVVEH